MAEFWYDIQQFGWNKEEKVFYADSNYLNHYGCLVQFPNQGRQFFIINKKTDNFRRFRLKYDLQERWVFESEDNIKCVVKKQLVRKVLIEKYKCQNLT